MKDVLPIANCQNLIIYITSRKNATLFSDKRDYYLHAYFIGEPRDAVKVKMDDKLVWAKSDKIQKNMMIDHWINENELMIFVSDGRDQIISYKVHI